MFLLFLLPVPLLNSGTSLLTAFSDWTVIPTRTSTVASSSPMSRAYTPVFPTSVIIISVIMPSAMTMMRPLLITSMPVRAPASASTSTMPSSVAPKQLVP